HIRASCSLKWITCWKRMQDSRDSNKRHASSFIYINTHILVTSKCIVEVSCSKECNKKKGTYTQANKHASVDDEDMDPT
ncbi:hypothetical protein S245_051842, partial [Arachis hypogaea]